MGNLVSNFLLSESLIMKRSNSFLSWSVIGCMLAALGLMFASSGCKSKKASNPLVVGMELSYPPFEMLDENGKPEGVGVDMANALAANLHRELVIENIPFEGLITALKTGKVDYNPFNCHKISFQNYVNLNTHYCSHVQIKQHHKSNLQSVGRNKNCILAPICPTSTSTKSKEAFLHYKTPITSRNPATHQIISGKDLYSSQQISFNSHIIIFNRSRKNIQNIGTIKRDLSGSSHPHWISIKNPYPHPNSPWSPHNLSFPKILNCFILPPSIRLSQNHLSKLYTLKNSLLHTGTNKTLYSKLLEHWQERELRLVSFE